MAGTERKLEPQPGLAPEAVSPLLGSLRLRLARLKRTSDPRASALASRCEAMLMVIYRELDDLAAERRQRR